MKMKTQTGQIFQKDHGIVMTVKNYGTSDLADGSVLIIDETNNDTTQSMMAVKTTTSADATTVVGVANGIIPAGGVGEMTVFGMAKVLMVSATYAAGDYVGSSTTAGSGAKGTYARGSNIGKVITGGTNVTSVTAFVNIGI